MAIDTAVTRLLDLDYPILLAPMAGGPTTPELVAAISNAGGLGAFGAAYNDGDGIRQLAAAARSRTNKPFGVNLFVPQAYDASGAEKTAAARALEAYAQELALPPIRHEGPDAPDFDAQIAAVVAERVALVSFHFGLPGDDVVRAVKESGARIAASATTIAEGRALSRGGADLVIAQGAEAGGHRGTFAGAWQDSMIGTFGLVRQLVRALDVPVVAAGGVMDGSALAAALALGAGGVQMGTAFLTCPEAGAHADYKATLLAAEDDSTVVTRTFSGRPARAIRNRFVEEMTAADAPLLPFPAQNSLTKGLRAAAARQNRPEFMSMWAGQAAALSRGLPAAELMAQIVREYEDVRAGLPPAS